MRYHLVNTKKTFATQNFLNTSAHELFKRAI